MPPAKGKKAKKTEKSDNKASVLPENTRTTRSSTRQNTKPAQDTRKRKPEETVESITEEATIESKPSPKKRGKKATKNEAKNEPVELDAEETDDDEKWKAATSIYEFKAKTITGKEVSLDQYEDHVCVIVNVASKCGYTKANYDTLVELFDKYSDEKGLRVLAFPCNQFGGQEPGDAQQICEFTKKKNVKFDLFEKIDVNGPNAHPLWKYLKEQESGPKGKDISWNFTKFIIDKKGNVAGRLQPGVKKPKLLEELEKIW